MWEEETPESFRHKVIWWLVGLVVVAGAGAAIWYQFLYRPSGTSPTTAAALPTPAPPANAPSVEHPLPAASGTSAALPALNDSDPLVEQSLSDALGRAPIEALLVPQNIVRH